MSRGIAAELFCICVAFSARVIRCTKSAALCSGVKLVSKYGGVAAPWATVGCTGKAKRSVPAPSTNLCIICVMHLFMLNLKSESQYAGRHSSKFVYSSVALARGRGRLAPGLEQPRREILQIAAPCLPLVRSARRFIKYMPDFRFV